MKIQRELRELLAKELCQHGVMEEAIGRYVINSIRICLHCKRLMNEGWLFAGDETFCSLKCFKMAYPDEDIKSLMQDMDSGNNVLFWTTWE